MHPLATNSPRSLMPFRLIMTSGSVSLPARGIARSVQAMIWLTDSTIPCRQLGGPGCRNECPFLRRFHRVWPPPQLSARTHPTLAKKIEGPTDEHSSRQYAFWCGPAGQAFGRPATAHREGAVHRRQAGGGRAVAACAALAPCPRQNRLDRYQGGGRDAGCRGDLYRLSLIHISEPTRRTPISYAVFCLK